MGKELAKLAGVVVLVVWFFGCMAAPVSLSGPTHPITANDTYTEIGPAEGSAWNAFILGIIPIGELSPARKAVDRALASSGGDALINTTIDQRWYMLGFLNLYHTKVKGTAVKIQKGGAVR
ncbi:MAG: hypothetical protein B5M53_10175 [Candidatus Cloacimonas sp. 4484_209]|nr:MAG: hypothetical protein B5M53_10175 [Candidatus Cloacimonas sp. 4484_209]